MKLGIQLYSVRETLGEDFTGTIKALKEMGFQGVEFAWNYGGMSPEEVTAFIKGEGLVSCGLHASLDDLCNPDSEPYKYAKAVGTPCVTTSCCQPDALENWDKTIESIKKAREVAASQGVKFTYHNHAQEFEKRDGKYLLDTLYESTSSETVGAELDTAWIKAGGEDPAPYIRKYPGRTTQIHLKDYATDSSTLVEIGSGDVDFTAVKAAAEANGAEWGIYELDASTLGSEMESARVSIAKLKELGF